MSRTTSSALWWCPREKRFFTRIKQTTNQKSRTHSPSLWKQFFQLSDFRVLHFGAYETVALKTDEGEITRVPPPEDRQDTRTKATNVLSVIHQHIYFPVYSNSLKDIEMFSRF